MSISIYFKPNIHQNGPEILGVKQMLLQGIHADVVIEINEFDKLIVI
jgi:hypothetical protein